jgi:hypothetical protein
MITHKMEQIVSERSGTKSTPEKNDADPEKCHFRDYFKDKKNQPFLVFISLLQTPSSHLAWVRSH